MISNFSCNMDTKFQTSFIPKKNLPQATSAPSHSVPIGLALLIAIIILIISAGAAGAVFAYKKILVTKITDMDKQLRDSQKSFEPGFIENISRLNKRIKSANSIINNHTVVSPVFGLLENDALATIKFDSFDYKLRDKNEGLLTLTGQAKSFTSIALQADIFSQEKHLKNPAFSDLNPNQKGNIVFKFTATVDSSFVYYKNNVNAEKQQQTNNEPNI